MLGGEMGGEAFEAGDIDAIVADLATDFTLYHAAREEPTPASAPIGRILTVARETMGDDFRFTEHAEGDGLQAVRWTTTIEGIAAEGVDIVREDDQGRLLELRINMRPLAALQAWNARMTDRIGRDPHQPDGPGP